MKREQKTRIVKSILEKRGKLYIEIVIDAKDAHWIAEKRKGEGNEQQPTLQPS